MLTRQKVILAILERVGRPVSPTMLVKLAFLLRQQTVLREDHTFYDFVPYRFGPFSFALYRELDSLRRDGYLNSQVDEVALDDGTRELSGGKAAELPAKATEAVATVVDRYAKLSQRKLVKSVYAQYPWYAVHSELIDLVPSDLPPRTTAKLAVYTVGYEGKSVDGFFDDLLRKGIRAILDVRANPISRKYGFARKSMSEIAAKLGLEYHHLPELGIESEERAELGDFASYQRLLDRYEQEMLPSRSNGLDRLVSLLQKMPAALLCVEKDVRCCHRGRLANAAAKRSCMEIVHL
jgi:uncharacterized protein (DUF488 family)